jgi:EAL domain-containing protein (putative c-di-GMP-specific phosphodiesterase class I)/DNA-binding NarL/FixJ family response regulator
VTSSRPDRFSEAEPEFGLDVAYYSRGVLIVDDSAAQRQDFARQLRQFGITLIYEARDGVAALELLRQLSVCPAVAIVDLEMPGMDGIEFAQRLRDQRAVPALVIASRADAAIMEAVETMIAALALPLLGALTKPGGVHSLREVLLRLRSSPGEPSPLQNARFRFSASRSGADAPKTREQLLRYRPRVSLRSGAIVAFEATPASIQDCCGEVAGHAVEMAPHELLGLALRQASAWKHAGSELTVAMTLPSASLVSSSLPGNLVGALHESGTAPARVTLQVCRGGLQAENPIALSVVNRLRIYGFGLSLDDCCSGYSSINWLSRLPFTEIKLDKELITQAERGQQSRIVLQSAIEMGRLLGLCTVADGVETLEQLKMLRAMGCDRAQGRAVGAALAVDEIALWLVGDERRQLQQLCA